ncbi:MAG: DUF4252 domain-containing protein [Flavobacteriales bacterium]
MKKIIGIVAIALISTTTYAQSNALDKYFSNYQENENFTKVNVSGKMFEMASFLETTDEDINEITEFASGVKSLRMLIGHEIGDGFGKYTRALNKVKNNYEELMAVDDKDGKFTFFIDENNGVVSEFVVVGAADSMLCLVSLTGQIDLKKLGNISRKIQTEGFDYIGKMNANGASKIKLYPNPSTPGGTINLELPEDLNGADLKVYSTSGKVVRTEKVLGSSMTLDLDGLESGSYVLDFTKGDISIKKKLMVN